MSKPKPTTPTESVPIDALLLDYEPVDVPVKELEDDLAKLAILAGWHTPADWADPSVIRICYQAAVGARDHTRAAMGDEAFAAEFQAMADGVDGFAFKYPQYTS